MRKFIFIAFLVGCSPMTSLPAKQVSLDLQKPNYVKPVNNHIEPYHYMTESDIRDAVIDLSTRYYSVASKADYIKWHLSLDIVVIRNRMDAVFNSLHDVVDERQLNHSRRLLQVYSDMIDELFRLEVNFRAEHKLPDE